jgi:hypothetical protein
MTSRRAWVWAVVLLIASSSCGSAAAPRTGASPTVVVLDAPIGLNTFALAPDGPAKLTSTQAFDAFLAEHPSFAFKLSDATSVQLGYLTAAVGDGTYSWKDQLAWGFTWDRSEIFAHSVPPDFPRSNTWWMFLDADTGSMLQSEWELGA